MSCLGQALLFIGVYARLAGPWASNFSYLAPITLYEHWVCNQCTLSCLPVQVLGYKPRSSDLCSNHCVHWAISRGWRCPLTLAYISTSKHFCHFKFSLIIILLWLKWVNSIFKISLTSALRYFCFLPDSKQNLVHSIIEHLCWPVVSAQYAPNCWVIKNLHLWWCW